VLQIRGLTADDIPLLRDFAPPDWKTDLSGVFGRHIGQPYFHPIAAELDGVLVGCAHGLLHGNAGWLGNVIVLPEFRRRGIGSSMTEVLIELFRAKRLQFQILIATTMGEPLYRGLGFQSASQYVFFEREGGPPSTDEAPGVRAMTPADEDHVFSLDKAATGELRQPFLSGCLARASVHVGSSGNVDGYYLPSLRNGLVIASNDTAGLALMHHRLNEGVKSAVVPEQNGAATHFLRAKGFVETARAARMTLGPDVDWQPERVYCRGAGYCG
jgi:GNAT superfamily N-acetyltransferase